VITDGEITVAESGAIIEYLLDTYGEGRLRPAPGTPERRRFTYWLHFAEGSAMPLMVMKLVFEQVRKAKVPFFLKPVLNGVADKVGSSFLDPNIESQQRFIESELATRPWFAGSEFSAADIQMSFPLEAAASRTALESTYPKAAAWLKRIHARPAYKAALKVGGPYKLMS
jgi:glutathione S-transferase